MNDRHSVLSYAIWQKSLLTLASVHISVWVRKEKMYRITSGEILSNRHSKEEGETWILVVGLLREALRELTKERNAERSRMDGWGCEEERRRRKVAASVVSVSQPLNYLKSPRETVYLRGL